METYHKLFSAQRKISGNISFIFIYLSLFETYSITMTKYILLLIAFISIGYTVAQDGIVIKETGGNVDYSSGKQTLIINANPADLVAGELLVDLDVENTTGYGQSWRITRTKPNVPNSWVDAICLTTCFPPSSDAVYCTPQNEPLAINDNATGTVIYHITPGNNSTATYKLYLGDCSSFSDSITIQVNFTAAVKEIKQTPGFSMYPNPANDNLLIQLSNATEASVKIVDVLGNVVYHDAIGTSRNISTDEFKSGVYFVMIEVEGIRLSSRKLVVKH